MNLDVCHVILFLSLVILFFCFLCKQLLRIFFITEAGFGHRSSARCWGMVISYLIFIFLSFSISSSLVMATSISKPRNSHLLHTHLRTEQIFYKCKHTRRRTHSHPRIHPPTHSPTHAPTHIDTHTRADTRTRTHTHRGRRTHTHAIHARIHTHARTHPHTHTMWSGKIHSRLQLISVYDQETRSSYFQRSASDSTTVPITLACTVNCQCTSKGLG